MRELALFAGAGGGILASRLLGWKTVCAVEIDGYRRNVLCRRQDDESLPPFPIWDDVRTFDGFPWRGRIDIVSGGFPCRAYSSAARGRNTSDDLWPEMRRVVAETAPRYVFAENVQRRAIDLAAEDLEQMGYKTRCIAFSASDLGAPHERRRFWLRAYADGNSEFCGPLNAKMDWMQELRPNIWSSDPGEFRVPNGLADRVERLGAIGEGQVPSVAATAWRILEAAA